MELCTGGNLVTRMKNNKYKDKAAANLMEQIEKGLEERQYANVLRLEVDDEIDNRLLNILKTNLEVKDEDIFRIQGPIDMTFLDKLYDMVPGDYDKFKFPPFYPQLNPLND